MTAPRVTAWSPEPGLLSEGPRWDEERRELLWVDILGRRFHRATLTADGRPDDVRAIVLDRHVGAVAPVAGGGYVLAAGQGFLFVDEDGAIGELAQPEAGHPGVRMNDGACDPQGASGPAPWPTTRRPEREPCIASSSTDAAPPC